MDNSSSAHSLGWWRRSGTILTALSVSLGSVHGIAATEKEVEGCDTERVLRRENSALEAYRDGRFEEMVAMEAGRSRTDEEFRKKQVKFFKKGHRRGFRVASWKILEASRWGRYAKVTTRVVARLRKSFFGGWMEVPEEEDSYWVCEDGEWYMLAAKPKDWGRHGEYTSPNPSRAKVKGDSPNQGEGLIV